jgi:outer membrane protein OmpA-like peptidoglycan-associated protein
LNSVRYVFFKVGSSAVTADQQPNVEMIANYLKNHPEAKVVVKGYASSDGNADRNIELANKRADAVKTALVKKYKISEDRVLAEGQGIGEMFTEQSWNRVSICTIEDAK